MLSAIGFTIICIWFASFAFMKGMTFKNHGLEGKKCDITFQTENRMFLQLEGLQPGIFPKDKIRHAYSFICERIFYQVYLFSIGGTECN